MSTKHSWTERLRDRVEYRQKPSLSKKTTFFRLMALAQKSGLGMKDSIGAIMRSENHAGFRSILNKLLSSINEGKSLADGMNEFSGFFSVEEIQEINAAESIGNLPDILENLADEGEEYQKIIGKLKSALTYPIILIAFSIIAIFILLTNVIPTIMTLFTNPEDLPYITKLIISLSTFLQQYYLIILFVILFVVLFFQLMYHHTMFFKIWIDDKMLRIPVISQSIKRYYIYRFCKMLSDFYRAGVSPVVAMGYISDVFTNYHYKKKVLDIQKDMDVGINMAESMEGSELFDPILVQVLHVGETTGTMGDVLGKISVFYRDLLNIQIQTMMQFIEPIIMTFIAVVIGGIVASVFLPLTEILTTFS